MPRRLRFYASLSGDSGAWFHQPLQTILVYAFDTTAGPLRRHVLFRLAADARARAALQPCKRIATASTMPAPASSASAPIRQDEAQHRLTEAIPASASSWITTAW